MGQKDGVMSDTLPLVSRNLKSSGRTQMSMAHCAAVGKCCDGGAHKVCTSEKGPEKASDQNQRTGERGRRVRKSLVGQGRDISES